MNRALLVREKVGKLVTLLTEKKVLVTQRGSRAYVEYDPRTETPRRVNIPYIPEDASEDYLAAIEGFLDHEVAHVLFTDPKVLTRAKKEGVAKLHNAIEDAFIEKKMADAFRGSASNLTNVGKFFLENYTEKERVKGPDAEVPVLMVPAIRALAGQRVYQDYMADKWHLVKPALGKAFDYLEEHLPLMSSSTDALEIALEAKRLMAIEEPEQSDGDDEGESSGKPSKSSGSKKSKKDKSEPPEDKGESGADGKEGEGDDGSEDGKPDRDDEDGGDGGDGEGKSAAKSGGEGSEDEGGERMGGHGAGSGEDGDGGNVSGFAESDGDALDSAAEDSSAGKPLTWGEFEDMLGSNEFDEKLSEALTERSATEAKEAEYLVYTTDKDVIEPLATAGTPDRALKAMQDRVDHMVGVLQKDLERAIAARSRAVQTAGHRSGRLHSGALARLTAFRDDRVFRRKEEATTKDVAISLLIDCSGSMSGEKIQIASYAAYGMSAVLDRMGINHEVLGFTTRGSFGHEARDEEIRLGVRYSRYEPLYMPVLKEYHERLGTEAKRRFAALSAAHWLCQNVDGESVQVAASRLSRRREQRKILMVLSDGRPSCPGDPSALRQHLKRTVRSIEASGIEVLGVGIMDEAPKSFYKKHVVLKSLADLPSGVMTEIKRILMAK